MRTFSGRRASQRADELIPMIELFRDRGVRRYLEIGARHGDTFHHVMKSLPKQSYGAAVDLGGGAWGTPASVPHLRRAAEDLVRKGYRIDVVLGDSTSRKVQNQIYGLGPFDAVLIDGDHRYAGVLADWEAYRDIAPIVAFHDIAGDGETTKDGLGLPVEVPRLWNEIKGEFEHVEFIGAASTMGIGVLVKEAA
jgi:hypothetical protein